MKDCFVAGDLFMSRTGIIRNMAHWWVPGLAIGFEHSFIHQLADFLNSLDGERPAEPTFEDAMATEKVINAVLRSAGSGEWEKAD